MHFCFLYKVNINNLDLAEETNDNALIDHASFAMQIKIQELYQNVCQIQNVYRRRELHLYAVQNKGVHCILTKQPV